MLGGEARQRAQEASHILFLAKERPLREGEINMIRETLLALAAAVPGGSTMCVMCSGTGLCYRCMTQEEQNAGGE